MNAPNITAVSDDGYFWLFNSDDDFEHPSLLNLREIFGVNGVELPRSVKLCLWDVTSLIVIGNPQWMYVLDLITRKIECKLGLAISSDDTITNIRKVKSDLLVVLQSGNHKRYRFKLKTHSLSKMLSNWLRITEIHRWPAHLDDYLFSFL